MNEKPKKDKINPKYPSHSLATKVIKYNSQDKDIDTKEYDTLYPIGSISKSFCGVTCALMATDSQFGNNGLNTTLKEILEKAQTLSQNKNKQKKIENYLKLLEKKNIKDVKIKEILTHTSGITTSYDNETSKKFRTEIYENENKIISPLEYFNSEAFLGEGEERKKSGSYEYSNDAYFLLEEVLNFISENGSFYEECKKRVIEKLNLSKTKDIEELNEEESKTVQKFAVFPDDDYARMGDWDDRIYTFKNNKRAPMGKTPIFSGGLCSTINNLKIYTEELGKLYMDLSNKLADKETTKKISAMFLEDCFEKTKEVKYYGYGLWATKDEKGNYSFSHEGSLSGTNWCFVKVSFDQNKTVEKVYCKLWLCNAIARRLEERLTEKSIKFIKNKITSEKNEEPKELNTHERKIYKKLYQISGRNGPRTIVEKQIFDSYYTKEGLIDEEKLLEDFKDTKEINRIEKDMLEKLKITFKGKLEEAKISVKKEIEMSFINQNKGQKRQI